MHRGGERSLSSCSEAFPPSMRDGYVVVDALVALAMLAATLIFSLSAVHQGLQAANRAAEVSRAGEHLKQLLETSKVTRAATSGQGAIFSWALTIGDPVATANAADLCIHEAGVSALEGRRRYQAVTVQICPAMAAP